MSTVSTQEEGSSPKHTPRMVHVAVAVAVGIDPIAFLLLFVVAEISPS